MTCIVGYKADGKVYMGGDGCASADHFAMTRTTPKVFKNGDFLFGITDSYRMGDLLEYVFVPPVLEIGDKYDRKYMCTKFIDALRLCFKEGGYSHIEDNEEEGGDFLAAVGGVLYEINEDFQVGLYESDFIAVGCGDENAMGAMYAIHDLESRLKSNSKLSPKEKITLALEAANKYSGWVSPPYTILNT